MFSCILTTLSDDLRPKILAETPMPSLIVGLGNDSELARTACKDALLRLAKHRASVHKLLYFPRFT